jgi:predicted RNA-binding Zn ribbon-like protein
VRKVQHIRTKLDHENEFIAGAPALDFANTLGGSRAMPTHDHIARYADLVAFAEQADLISKALATKLLSLAKTEPAAAGEVLERGIRLREAVWSAFTSKSGPRAAEVAVISDEAARAATRMKLGPVPAGGFAFKWGDDVELDRVLWPIARSAVELLTSEVNRGAVRECESDTCAWLFLDRTRNHSRRWCDMGDCGNRAKARRFRERRARYRA